MKEYIYKKSLVNAIKSLLDHNDKLIDDVLKTAIIELIEKYPSIKIEDAEDDVEPLCKNCANWYRNWHTNGDDSNCFWTNREVPKEDDYCSRWEENKYLTTER